MILFVVDFCVCVLEIHILWGHRCVWHGYYNVNMVYEDIKWFKKHTKQCFLKFKKIYYILKINKYIYGMKYPKFCK